MARGPSPGTASGHPSEALRTFVAGPLQPLLKAPSEDHLDVSWTDFCFIRGPVGAGTGIIRLGESPELIGQSLAATRPLPAELCQVEMGVRKGLGYPG
jgi:hypothetical protein